MRVATLEAFAGAIDRAGLESRPVVWVQFIDIWGVPRGELGYPDTDDLADVVFALLTPWAVIPTIGEAWLIVDRLDWLEVVHLTADLDGVHTTSWRMNYHVADDGVIGFLDYYERDPHPAVTNALTGTRDARFKQTFWSEGHTIETILPAVDAMLHR